MLSICLIFLQKSSSVCLKKNVDYAPELYVLLHEYIIHNSDKE